MKYESIAIAGPTASGKTSKAVAAAMAFDGEVISADSRQVYVGMDLGTGKDLEEYGDVAYHLIDVAPAGSKYNLHRYLRDFRQVYDDVLSRHRMPVVCGGSGMYLENALGGVRLPDVPENPELRASLEGKNLDQLTDILSAMKSLHNTTDVDTCKRAIRAIEIQQYY
ncbi:MAG: tRNA (adenosine(37)-N6)-dimethylallyltransferase MiaA, partial [Muribaculaceae bacterium]|nr:tRNA (adenosine(37)-N6)-dimethylallyltransferase MiaA [Muribaculaceae bacterium]